MIKKILSCILCLCLLPLAAFAEVDTPISINSETKAFGITGTSSQPNSELIIIVTKPNVAVNALTPELMASSAALVYTLDTNADGSYTGQFYLPDSAPAGDYTVYVGSQTPVTFYYADAQEIAKCIDDIQKATVSNIGARMTYYTKTQKILGLDLDGDYSVYSDAADSVMIDYITKSKPTLISTVQDYFAKSVEAAVLIKSDNKAAIKAALEANKTEISIDSAVSTESLADMYLTLRDSSVTNVDKIAYALRCAAALCRINTATRGAMTDVLTAYNDVLLLDLDGDYASIDKVEVNKALVNKGFTSVFAVQQAFSASVTQVKGESGPGTEKDNNSGKVNNVINVSGGSTGTSTPSVISPETAPSASFTDIPEAAWAADYINALAAKNIINGVGNGKFDPNGIVTREQYVKMLLGAFGIETESAESKFADVDNSMWYAPYVATACAAGIISGISETEFGIGMPISREQMAAMSVRIMEKYGVGLSENEVVFADKAQIASYAYRAVCKLTASGIINGINEAEFAPKANLTRAQAAKVIYLIMKAGGYIA